jgi:hypothetical protein
MTTQQIADLRKMYLPGRFKEYREALREEARRLGYKVGANDIIKVLEAHANDENKLIKDSDGKLTQRDSGEPIPEAKENPNPNPSGDSDGGEPKPIPDTPKDDGGDDDLAKKREEMRKRLEDAATAAEEAKRKQDEADKLRKELDELNRKLEEKKRKEEEERKRKEQEDMKNLKHYKADELIETLKITGLAYLVGPAGTGKSTLAMDACVKMFGVPKEDWKFKEHFAQISFSPDTTSGEMIGRCDINGIFHRSEVVRVFGEGGLILFDEIDNADASMLVKLNTAIANGQFATPEGLVCRHKDTVIVCTANTFGTGPDAMYVGRSRLDAATIDRFTLSTIEVDYDVNLEKKIASVIEDETKKVWLLDFVKRIRKAIKDKHFRRLCSTRFVINAVKWLEAGHSTTFVEDRFLLGWTDTEKQAVKNG